MRMVEIKKPFSNAGVKFEVGKKMVMAEDIEAQLRTSYGDALGMSYPIDSLLKPYKGEDLSGKSLMSFRTGGIGDLAWVNVPLRWLKHKYPTCHLRAASACKQFLENVPEIDEVYDMPFDAELLNKSDYTVMFQGILETSSEESKKFHAVDMFFKYFGIDSIQFPAEEKVPRLFFNKKETDWLAQVLPTIGIRSENYVVGIQMETSAPLRNFPKEKMKVLVDALSKEDKAKVILIGTEQHEAIGQFLRGNNPNVILATRYSVRQIMVMATRFNLVISPDSFMIQVAGALDKPLIGLYGPFPSEVRMKYFKNAIGLDPSVVCSPCFRHDFRACIKGYPSPCFTQLDVDNALQAADFLKFKFTGQHFNYMGKILKDPDLSAVEQYILSADKGLAFFPRYFKHHNMITVDPNKFTGADIDDLNMVFSREAYPFVIYFNEIHPKHINVYNNSKGMIRPGGYFIVYREEAPEGLYNDVKMDVGKSFTLMYTNYDPATRTFIIVGKRAY